MPDSKYGSRDFSQPGSDRLIDLTTTLYGELRKLAAAKLAGQPSPQTLQATALVHEAWLKLAADKQPKWNDREHFFSSVALAMQHILVDRARRRNRIRHGGGLQRIDMDAWNWENLDAEKASEKDKILLILDELMKDLEEIDPQAGRMVQLHYFAGLSPPELSTLMNVSERTIRRRLAYARAWLNKEIRLGLAS